jgi:hypothetical protein
MGKLSEREDEWLRKATEAAISSARRVALNNPGVVNTPAGRLNDNQWGWIVTAAICGWIDVRVQQAIEEGLDQEETVRRSGTDPDASDVAVVHSILPGLADRAEIDWSVPLQAWSKETMTRFLLMAWRAMEKAEIARDHGPGKIVRKTGFDPAVGDPVPF